MARFEPAHEETSCIGIEGPIFAPFKPALSLEKSLMEAGAIPFDKFD
jgi:hypothetical protein